MRNLGIPSLVVLAQNFSWGFNHDVGRAAVIWQLDWNCGIHFQDGALSWLLAGGLGSSPHGLFNRLLSFFMAVGFPLSGLGNPRENKAETSMCFMTKPIEVTHRYLYNILIVRNASLSPHQKGGGLSFIFWVGDFQGIVGVFSTFSRASTASELTLTNMVISLLAAASFLALQGPEPLSPLLQPCSHCIPGQMRSHDVGFSNSPSSPPSKLISLCRAFTEHNYSNRCVHFQILWTCTD